MVPSQIVPCVKVTLCGLACQLPARPFSASASGLPASLFYTLRHTPTIIGPLHVQARVRYLPSAAEQLLSRLCSLLAGALLSQLLILELT